MRNFCPSSSARLLTSSSSSSLASFSFRRFRNSVLCCHRFLLSRRIRMNPHCHVEKDANAGSGAARRAVDSGPPSVSHRSQIGATDDLRQEGMRSIAQDGHPVNRVEILSGKQRVDPIRVSVNNKTSIKQRGVHACMRRYITGNLDAEDGGRRTRRG